MASIPAAANSARILRLSWGLREVVIAGACLAVFAILLFNPRVLNDGDTYWHLAAGQWMLDHGRVPNFDPFSFTHGGQPWVPHEWLSEIAMIAAYKAAGWTGIVVLFGLATALSMGLFLGWLSRWLGPIALAVVAWLSVGCMWVGLFTRPHLLALPIMIYWTGRLLDARAEGRAPPLWLAGLMVLWANLHGSFVFGALVAAPLALEALWEQRRQPWPVIRDWGLFAAACLVAILLTPNGLHAITYPFHIMTMKTLNGIVEWLPPDFRKMSEFQAAILVTLLVCLSRGVKVPVFRTLLLLFIFHMALTHQRHMLVLALIGPLLLAEPIGRSFGRQAPRPLAMPWLPAVVFALGALVMIGVRAADPVVRNDAVTTPKIALQHVPVALRAQPVLNTYSFGGYLAFSGVKPFIDGRADMYGDDFFSGHIRLMRGDAAEFDRAAAKYGLAWTILQPREPLAKQMDAKPGWKLVYRDRWAVVHARKDALEVAGR
ncbi:hypothetical protein LJR219_001472 [Phenylobacterium sp. LjRoot219]|uniref:hypothetical protein n=1 Tax=Phenylobacterium sp. LjRoot219 TaxID=3342283 RepID=UPI003ECFC0F7